MHQAGSDIGTHSVRYSLAVRIKIYCACARPTQVLQLSFLTDQTVDTFAMKRELHFEAKFDLIDLGFLRCVAPLIILVLYVNQRSTVIN